MSDVAVRKIGDRAREAGTQAAWRQWASLGASALRGQEGDAQAIVDPEALLLVSLYLEPAERRLGDFTRWWAEVGSELLSVQRTKTLLRRFPPEAEERLQVFAGWAVESGDKRWRRYAHDGSGAGTSERSMERGRKGADRPRLQAFPALMLRLRAGFGVSAKADVLAYLLGINEREVSTQETADATAYSRATVGGALGDMARAGFIRETGDRSARYFAPARPWTRLLGFGDRPGPGDGTASDRPPPWRYWSGLFAFLAKTDRWAQGADDSSGYVLSSRARDLFERHKPAFERNRIDVPRPEEYRGADYLEGFEETIHVLAHWMADHM